MTYCKIFCYSHARTLQFS